MNLSELKEWLKGQDFRIGPFHHQHVLNTCDWYAYRRSIIPARRCECNDDKVNIQLVVTPYAYAVDGKVHESVQLDIRGEVDGDWYNLQAYGLRPETVAAKLPQLEERLVAAWNVLKPFKEDECSGC